MMTSKQLAIAGVCLLFFIIPTVHAAKVAEADNESDRRLLSRRILARRTRVREGRRLDDCPDEDKSYSKCDDENDFIFTECTWCSKCRRCVYYGSACPSESSSYCRKVTPCTGSCAVGVSVGMAVLFCIFVAFFFQRRRRMHGYYFRRNPMQTQTVVIPPVQTNVMMTSGTAGYPAPMVQGQPMMGAPMASAQAYPAPAMAQAQAYPAQATAAPVMATASAVPVGGKAGAMNPGMPVANANYATATPLQ